MKPLSAVKTFAFLMGILLVCGAGLWRGLSAADKEGGQKKKDAPEGEEKSAKDKFQRLNGTWKVVYSEGDLSELKVQLPKGSTLQMPKFLIIDKDRLTWDNGNADDPSRLIHFDGKESPKKEDSRFALTPFGTSGSSNRIHGNYELDREYLRICLSTFAAPRGLWVDDAGQKHNFVVQLQRVDLRDPKAAAKEAADEADDLRLLQGQWRIAKIVGANDDNEWDQDSIKVGYRFLFQGSKFKILRLDTDDVVQPYRPFQLRTGTNPKQIVAFQYYFFSGIYRIEKDRLRICRPTAVPEDLRFLLPKNFDVANDSKSIQLIELERVDAEKPTDAKTRLLNLRKAHVRALREQLDSLESRIYKGTEYMIIVLDSSDRLMDAEMELAADKKSRVQVMEANLKRLITYERLLSAEYNAAKKTKFELAQVKARRLSIEILLEKEKEK